MFNVLAISGSLRSQSYNTALLNTLKKRAPSDWSVDLCIPKHFPVYDEDLQTQQWPEIVLQLERRIRNADCVVISTPEYNYSIPGGLKNVIDWVSRRPQQPFKNKQVGIMGVSSGRMGAIRAQLHLRQCFQFLESHVISRPEVLIGNASTTFSNQELTEPSAIAALDALIQAIEQRRTTEPSHTHG